MLDRKRLSYARYGKLLAVICVILVLGLLRLVNLGADTPAGMSGSAALYVDEGYKTLTARNMVVFGEPRWNPRDDYHGWINTSPLTHWAYYWAFQAFGPTVESARVVTIVFLLLFLASYAVGLYGRYDTSLFFAGLIILGIESTVFFFSRVALFELPLATFLYMMLYSFSRFTRLQALTRIYVVLLVAVFLTLLVKRSALLYLVPILAAVAFPLVARLENASRVRLCIFFLLTAAVLGLLLFFTLGLWGSRIILEPAAFLAGLLRNPLVQVSPIVVILGLFCAVHGAVARPSLFLQDPYRISLMGIITLTPAILALFPYGPLRYYLPILPAYILIILEWTHLRGWTFASKEYLSKTQAMVAVGLITLLVFYAASTLNGLLKMQTAVQIGSDPGISDSTMLRLGAPISFLVALAVWTWRAYVFRTKVVATIFTVAMALFLLHNSYTLGRFFFLPQYEAKQIRADFSRILPDDATVAGDWAPFFALGTDIKALYMNRKFNTAGRVLETKPDYFLYSETEDSSISLEGLRTIGRLSIGEPVYKSRYAGRKVILYPLTYTAS